MCHGINNLLKISVVLILLILLAGCSSGGQNPLPTAPDQNPGSGDSSINGSVTALTDSNSETNTGQSAESGHFLLGYSLIYIDATNPDDVIAEMVPLRESEIHLNILKLLEDGPCTNCFKIVEFNFPVPGTLNVDIQIDHPFGDLLYSVFDVRGIMMFQGSHTFPVAGKAMSDPVLGDGALLNADGYTALFNGSTVTAPVGVFQKYYPGNYATVAVPNSIINGYKYYVTDNPSNNRNAFYGDSSGVDVQTFSIKLPTGPFVLGYAVDANWWLPISEPVDDPLTDFDLNANCPEPWKVVVTEVPIGDGLTDHGGQTKLLIDVYDWQGKSTHHDPVIECPELFDDTLSATWLEDGSGYARYEVTLSNANLTSTGDYMCLVNVEANENNPIGKPWLDLTAYMTKYLTVSPFMDQSPVAIAAADPNPQQTGNPVHLFDDGSFDPDGGLITKYEWDIGADGSYEIEGSETWYTENYPGIYLVQLRVTDD
ncbi:MAG: hypothetical protein NTY09_00805, partial [bacterium]|nr:hypothetical protein [bacterium]